MCYVGKLKIQNLEQKKVENLPSLPFEGPSGIICNVIEEELHLHFG